MRFVRISVNHATGEIIGVAQQDTPFEDDRGGSIVERLPDHLPPAQCETFDLGVVEDHDWRDAAGNPTHPARHIHEALIGAKLTSAHVARGAITPAQAGLRAILDCPCTHAGIRARLRAKGLAGVPSKVRAWLAAVLPDHHVDAMGIAAGIPISARKAAEGIRMKRDPRGGSRLATFERIAQGLSDSRAAAHLARRRAKEK